MKRAHEKAFSLIELVMVVAVIGVIIGLTKLSAQFYANTFHHQAALTAQQQAEVVMYAMTREIRNAAGFPIVKPDVLQIVGYDLTKGFDTDLNTTLLAASNISTVTYRIKMVGDDRYLSREFDAHNKKTEKRLLVNALDQYDFQLVLSTSVPSSDVVPNIRGVRVFIRLKSIGVEKAVTYTGESMMRTGIE